LLAASLVAAIRQAVRNRQLPAASRFLRRLRFALSSFWKRIQAACCERASSASRCARCFLSRSDRKRFGKDPRYRLRHAGLVIRCRFSCGIARDSGISRTLLSPGPQPAPAPQFRSTALGSDLATFDPFTGRGEIEIANGFANILPTPLRPISRVLAKVSSSTRLPVDSIVRPLAISRWSAQNSL
jgi:hypothetical protein